MSIPTPTAHRADDSTPTWTYVTRDDVRAEMSAEARITIRTSEPAEWPGWIAPAGLRRRPLTGIEVGLLRWASLDHLWRAATIGAIDAGATCTELGYITPQSVTWSNGEPVAQQVGAPRQ